MKARTAESVQRSQTLNEVQAEFAAYFATPVRLAEDGKPVKQDPIAFWISESKRFPSLARLSLSLLAIQASSAESERLFSAGGWHTEGRKNRLEKEQLTNKVFLSCNKRLFSKVIFSR